MQFKSFRKRRQTIVWLIYQCLLLPPQSFRAELRGMLETDECPPLEMEQLQEQCFAIAVQNRPSE